MTLPDPPILVITDRARSAAPIEARAEALFRGGCRWLSLREKDMEPQARRDLLLRLRDLGARFGAQIGVHDDLPAAEFCGVGLHLPSDGDPRAARQRLGMQAVIGLSCHTAEALRAAAGSDYATLSPVFETASKPGYQPGLSLAALSGIAAASPVPVLALGGVGLGTIDRLDSATFAGIAVMGEAMRCPDPAGWFDRLSAAWAAQRYLTGASGGGGGV